LQAEVQQFNTVISCCILPQPLHLSLLADQPISTTTQIMKGYTANTDYGSKQMIRFSTLHH